MYTGCVPVILTGSEVIDQIFSVLLSTSMFVGGVTGFILDTGDIPRPLEK